MMVTPPDQKIEHPLAQDRAYVHNLPDGSRHELRKDDDFHAYNENITGLFYSVDGTRLIYDTTTGTLYLRMVRAT